VAFSVTNRGTDHNGTTATATIDVGPFTPTASSLLLAFCQREEDNSAATVDNDMSDPTGGSLTYTTIEECFVGASTFQKKSQLWYAQVGASPSSMSVTFDGSPTYNCWYVVGCVDITGHDSTDPIAQSEFSAEVRDNGDGSTQSVTLPGALTTGNLVVVYISSSVDNGGQAPAAPTLGGQSMTQVQLAAPNEYEQFVCYYRVVTGAESNATVTCSDVGGVNTYSEQMIAVEINAEPAGDGISLPHIASSSTLNAPTVASAHPQVAATGGEVGTSLGTSNAQTLPSGSTTGSLVVVWVTHDNPGGTAITASTGWTQIFAGVVTGNVLRHACFARILDGGANDTLTISGTTQDYCVSSARITNHGVTDVATQIKTVAPATNTSGNADPPSLDAGVSDEWLWLASAGVDFTTGNTISANPANYSDVDNRTSASSTSSCGQRIAKRELTTQTQDPGTFTNTSQEWVAGIIAIPPVPGAPQSVSLPAIASTETLHTPNIVQVLALPLIASVTSLFAPSVATGPVTLQLPHISSAEVLYAPTITPPPQSISLPAIASTTTLNGPLVEIDSGGGFEIVQHNGGTMGGTSGTQFTATLPAPTSGGDLLLAVSGVNDMTTPSGWTALERWEVADGGDAKLYVFRKNDSTGEDDWVIPLDYNTFVSWIVIEANGMGSVLDSERAVNDTSPDVAFGPASVTVGEDAVLFFFGAVFSTFSDGVSTVGGYTNSFTELRESGGDHGTTETTIAVATRQVSAGTYSTAATATFDGGLNYAAHSALIGIAATAGSGDQTVVLPHLSSSTTLHAPTVSMATQSIALPHIASTTALNAPNVIHVVAPPHITSTSTLNAPSVAVGAVTLALPHIASTTVLYAPSVPSGRWPTAVSANDRWIEDQFGEPWVFFGDAAWGAVAQLTAAEYDEYLEGIAAVGFNCVMTSLIENHYSDDPPNNVNGDGPYAGTMFQSSPVDAYWDHVELYVQKAAALGITVLAAPCYFGNSGDGVALEFENASVANIEDYGTMLGQRFAAYPNIIWMVAGDRQNSATTAGMKTRVDAMVLAWQAEGANQLVTAHQIGDETADLAWGSYSWLQLNNSYESSYNPVNRSGGGAVVAWNDSPTRPTFHVEGVYELDETRDPVPAEGAVILRYQAYGPFMAGANGHVFGAGARWHYDSGDPFYTVPGVDWRDTMPGGSHDLGTIHFGLFADFVTALPNNWETTLPDTGDTFLTAGEQTGGDGATARFSTSLGLVYMPNSRSVTLDLGELTAFNFIRVRRYDPTNGTYTVINNYRRSAGAQVLSAPGNNAKGDSDWALIVDEGPGLELPAIASTTTLHPPTVSPGAVTVELPHIASTTTLNPPTVAAPTATIEPPHIASATVLNPPTITTGAVTVDLPHIASESVLNPPTASPGAVTVVLPHIASTSTLNPPTITTGAVTVALPHIASVTVLNPPTVTPGLIGIVMSHIDSTTALYEPAVAASGGLATPHIDSTNVLHPPTITTGAVTISLPHIASANTVNAPAVALTLALPHIASTEVLNPPIISAGGITLALPHIASTETLHPPAVAPGAVTVALPHIDSVTAVNPPAVTAGFMLVLPHIPSTNDLDPPTISVTAVTIVIPHIASTTVLYPPATGALIADVVLDIWDAAVVDIWDPA
jgi:hypothetical protein